MTFSIYLGVVGLNWLIIFKEYKILKKRLLNEGYVFNKNKKLSNENLFSFIQLITNTIIPGVNILNILNITFMKEEIYNLTKTILLLDDIIEYEGEVNNIIIEIEEQSKNDDKPIKITRMDKIKQLKKEKEKLLDNYEINQKQYILKK